MWRFILFFVPILSYALPGYFEPWGKDADLKLPAPAQETPQHSLAVLAAEKIIWFHQNIISPVDGPRSHFRPSSSNYMLFSMRKNGFIKGFIMGCDRLLRENEDPWVYRTIYTEGKIFKWDPP